MKLFLSLIFISLSAYSKIGFWRFQIPKLDFVTTAQSVYSGACSGVTTVQTKSGSGAAINVTADTTVNLSTSGAASFFSDSACTKSISSITIYNGYSSNNFYFLLSTTGSETFTADATGYISASQIETFLTNPYVWTGAGGDNHWSTGPNWSGGSAPGSTNQALFNGVCSSNCSPSILSDINVAGVRIVSGYTGTITQNSGVAIVVGSAGWVQTGAGVFVGSAGTTASNNITISTQFKITAGSFQASASTLQVESFEVSGLGSFNANNGLVYFSSSNCSIISGSAIFNDVTTFCAAAGFNGSTMNVNGKLTLNGGYNAYLNNGTILASGDVISKTGGGYGNVGTALVKLVGNASGQTVTGEPGSTFTNLEIDTGSNNVTLIGEISIYGNWTNALYKVTSVGTLTTTGSTLNFSSSTVSAYPSSANYNNVIFGTNVTLNGNTMNVAGNTSILGGYNRSLVNGTVNCYGNITASTAGYGSYGSMNFVAKGNAAGQTITSLQTDASIPNLVIDAGVHDVTLSGNVNVWGAVTVSSVGALNVTGSTLMLTGAGGFINSGGKNFESIVINDARSLVSNSFTATSSVTVGPGASLNMSGLALTSASMTLNGATVTKSGGVLTIGGSSIGVGSFFGGTIAP